VKKLWPILLLLAGCSKEPVTAPAPELPFQTLGGFEYKEKMSLPPEIKQWNGKVVRASGFINPLANPRGLTSFLLVKDRMSCCYGKMPQMNHYLDVKLKPGQKTDYSTDPVQVQGLLHVEERWDGDWPLGLYWMTDAEMVK
jgi:hypothetical protein